MERWILPNVVKSFFKNDALVHAESIAFCGLLAMIPLGMLMASAAGFVLGSFEDVFDQLVKGFGDLVPWGKEIFVANLKSIMEKRSHLSIFGVAVLIFIATLLVSSIELAFDKIFRAERSRNFFHSRLLGVGMIFLITLLLFLPTIAIVLEMAIKHMGIDVPLAAFMQGKFYFFIVMFIAYVMIVVIIPNKKVYARYAVIGGVLFSAGVGIAKYIFQWYLTFSLTRYNIIYGSLSAVVLMVVWMYYLSLLLLFSAEVVSEMQHRKLFQGKRKKKS